MKSMPSGVRFWSYGRSICCKFMGCCGVNLSKSLDVILDTGPQTSVNMNPYLPPIPGQLLVHSFVIARCVDVINGWSAFSMRASQ